VKICCDLELITVVKLCWMHVCESTSKECNSELLKTIVMKVV
jgi:hypothetical protein